MLVLSYSLLFQTLYDLSHLVICLHFWLAGVLSETWPNIVSTECCWIQVWSQTPPPPHEGNKLHNSFNKLFRMLSAFIYCAHFRSKNHYFNEKFQWKVISKLHQREQHSHRTYQKENYWGEICFCLQAATLIERKTSLLHFSSCHFFACSRYFASEKPDGIATFSKTKILRIFRPKPY